MNSDALSAMKLAHCNVRSVMVRDALQHFQNPGEAWHAIRHRERSAESGLGQKSSLLDRGLAWLEEHDSHLIAWHDDDYPSSLRHVSSPPPFLFVRGRRDLLWHPQIAIVGTRNPSAGGLEAAQQFAGYLAAQGYVVTSGLATGIDAAAHAAALQSGTTIAVLATGPDLAFPRSNGPLYQRICENGTVITEHPPGVPALRCHFPARNRLIAGLAQATLVIEAAIRSGALITARLTVELGKDVMAVPGSIRNPVAFGCHQLIREGAYLVAQPEEVEYILRSSQYCSPALPKTAHTVPKAAVVCIEPASLNTAQQQVWQALGHDCVGIDSLCQRTGLTAADISSILVGMEISGWVATQLGRYHRRSS